MANWLINTLQGSRVKALLLELRWDLEASSVDRTARILIGAQTLRVSTIDPEPNIKAVIDDPFSYGRDQLMDVYGQIEDARNLTLQQAKAIESQSARIGMAVPEMIRQRTIEARRSLEVWMATAGSAIVKNGHEHGSFIWGKLKESLAQLQPALAQLREVERKLDIRMYEATDEEILKACEYLPAAFSKRPSAEPDQGDVQQRQDEIAKACIRTAKSFGAKTAREAAEMTAGREIPTDEWDRVRVAWERNWK